MIGIASSRLGRRLDKQAAWFNVFRAACSKIDHNQDVLFTAAETTPERFVQRAADLFEVRVVSMICPREDESIGEWSQRIRKLDQDCGRRVFPGYVSPEFQTAPVDSARSAEFANAPLRDQVVVSLSDKLLVFHLRRAGHLDQLVRRRLDDSNRTPATVFIALGEDLIKRELADELLDLGAVGWVVLDTPRPRSILAPVHPRPAPAPIIALPASEPWSWLTHCTRSQLDGWPDQGRTDYIDELLLNADTKDHSTFASLQRIITMQRLIATSRMIRGRTDVVCFTAVPLCELPKLRTFRSHLARWDFEPYGLCIQRDWLTERACLPVRYGDESLWESLASAERPFFQVRTSESRQSRRIIDWSVEQEWRHVGEINLDELPADKGLVFVPSLVEAEQLALVSRWPVAVLEG